MIVLRKNICIAIVFCLFFTLGIMPAQKACAEDNIPIGETTIKLEPIPGTENLIKNGDFETLKADGISFENWNSSHGWGEGKSANVVGAEQAHSGNYAVSIKSSETASYPSVVQSFETEGRAVYQFSIWVKKSAANESEGITADKNVTVKLEFYPDTSYAGAETKTVAEHNTFSLKSTNGEWQNILFNFRAPFTALKVQLMARVLANNGESVLFDDISVYMVEPPAEMNISTDSVFYYPEQTEGMATVTAATRFFPEAKGGYANIAFLPNDSDIPISEERGVWLNNSDRAYFNFSTASMVKKKEYFIRADLYSADGEYIATQKTPVYRFDRPRLLDKNGVHYNMDGSVFTPVLAYKVAQSQYPKCKEAGISVVQGGVGDLEAAAKYGIKVLVTLYPGMKPAGHSSNAAKTKATVEAYKDDPRVFGWAIMDEPYLNLPDPADDLRESYRIIREIDDNHPVYICEANEHHFEEVVKFTDVFAPDPYLPGSRTVAGKMNTTHVLNMIQKAKAASGGIKPVLGLLQAFKWYKYLPDGMAERHMIYQNYLGGATAHGYFCIAAGTNGNSMDVALYDVTENDIWQGIVDFGEKEKELVYSHFTKKEYKGFNHRIGEDFAYHSFIKDDKIYMLILNQSITENCNAEIPLESFDESIKIDGFTAEYFAGGSGSTISGSNTLHITLAPYEATVLCITPDDKQNFESLNNELFWVYTQKPSDEMPVQTKLSAYVGATLTNELLHGMPYTIRFTDAEGDRELQYIVATYRKENGAWKLLETRVSVVPKKSEEDKNYLRHYDEIINVPSSGTDRICAFVWEKGKISPYTEALSIQ